MELDKIRYRTIASLESSVSHARASNLILRSYDEQGNLIATNEASEEHEQAEVSPPPPAVPDSLKLYIENRREYFPIGHMLRVFICLASLEFRARNTWLPVHDTNKDGANQPGDCIANVERQALQAVGSGSLSVEAANAEPLCARPLDLVCWFAGQVKTYSPEDWVRPLVRAFKKAQYEEHFEKRMLGHELQCSVENRYEFRLAGSGWVVSYGQERTTAKDVKGARYLSELLARSDKAINAVELEAIYAPTTRPDCTLQEKIDHGETAIQATDERTIATVKRAISDFEKESEIAGLERQEEIQEEIRKLKDYLSSTARPTSQGPGLTPRVVGSRSVRAGKNCRERIEYFIEKSIRKQCPEFAKHLDSSLFYGCEISYRPIEKVGWEST